MLQSDIGTDSVEKRPAWTKNLNLLAAAANSVPQIDIKNSTEAIQKVQFWN